MDKPYDDIQNNECRLCGADFDKKAPQQVFCCKEHKKQFEKILSTLLSEIRQPLHKAALSIAEAKSVTQ